MNILSSEKSEIISKTMNRLSFDVTRRCNLNCKWCCKGDAQNKDITKEIVDKVIEEMKGVYIAQIRFWGGEPFLNAEMIEYIIDKLIQEKILFGSIGSFTNGTIRSEKIVNSFKKALKYIDEIEDEIELTKNALNITFGLDSSDKSLQKELCEKRIQLCVSGHEGANSNIQEVEKTIEFYNSKIGGSFLAVNPYDEKFRKDTIVYDIEGKFEKNYMDYIKSPVTSPYFRKIANKYCIMKSWTDEPEKKYISKAMSVSVDGKVYVGCSMPYERIEKEYIFNINECNKDFFAKVSDWCYEHNISYKANRLKERYEAVNFLRSKDIQIEDINDGVYNKLRMYNEILKAQEIIAKDLHNICPTLLHDEVECMAIATTCLTILEKGFLGLSDIKIFLLDCTDFDSYTISMTSKEYLRGLILFLSEKDRKRKDEMKNDK